MGKTWKNSHDYTRKKNTNAFENQPKRENVEMNKAVSKYRQQIHQKMNINKTQTVLENDKKVFHAR